MNSILARVRAHSVLIAVLAYLAYEFSFFVPDLLAKLHPVPPSLSPVQPSSGGETPLSLIQDSLGQLVSEGAIAVFLILVISVLGWWRAVGFRRVLPGGLKYVLLLLGVTVGWEVFKLGIQISDGGRDVFMTSALGTSAAFAATFLLVGFTEELVYRGLLFQILRSVLSPVVTVVVSALIFGVSHFSNVVHGASFLDTVPQVTHAAALGFVLGALRLRGGAIWPLMLFHGLWDLTVKDLMVTNASIAPAAGAAPAEASAAVQTAGTLNLADSFTTDNLLLVLYGIFVLWRYTVARKAGKIVEPATPGAAAQPAQP